MALVLAGGSTEAAMSFWSRRLLKWEWFWSVAAFFIAQHILLAESPGALSRDDVMWYSDRDGSIRPVRSAMDWSERKRSILNALQEVMGPMPSHDGLKPPLVDVDEEVDCGSYVRRKIRYQCLTNAWVPAYLLIPKAALTGSVRVPAVLTLHQTHQAGQKVVVGLGQSPDDEYGVELVQRGYVCLAPPYPMLAEYWPDVPGLGFQSGTMFAIWINRRGLDLLASLPYVKTNGFGAMGHSLGGHNGLFTAAFDDRIRVVVTSCGFDRFRDYYDGDPKNWAPGKGWCQGRYMPKLAVYQHRLSEIPVDFGEILAVMAPRKICISAPLEDSNFRWRSVDQAVATAQPVFELLGKGDSIRVQHPKTPHRFSPEIRQWAYREMDRILRPTP